MDITSKKLIRKLTVWQVVIIGVAYLTPMTVFDTFGIVSGITSGRVPMAYLVALGAILLTALSYGRLAKVFPSSGSAYTYTKNVCGNISGFLVGWASLLDYLLLPMINALLAGIYLRSLFPGVPHWIWIVLFAGFVTFVNSRNIQFLANLNFLFVSLPVFLTMVFIYLVVHNISVKTGTDHVWTIKPLLNGQTDLMALMSGAAVLCFSFLGFDAVTTLAHETHDPKVVIPRAIFLTVLCGGVIFFVSAWFIQLYYPTNEQFKNPTEAMPEIVLYVGGAFFQSIFLVAILVNTLASALASHASAARLLHRMACDGVFPSKLLQYTHPEYGCPLFCVIFIGILSLSAMFFNLDTAVSLISFGAMIAFSSVNLCIFILFVGQKKEGKTVKQIMTNVLLPFMAMLTVLVMWCNLQADALILGLTWSAVGILYILYFKFTNKKVLF